MSINQARTNRRQLVVSTSPVLSDITNIPATEANKKQLNNYYEEREEGENVLPAGSLDDGRRVRFNSGENVEKFLTPNSSLQVILSR
jgi:hypothetical protein